MDKSSEFPLDGFLALTGDTAVIYVIATIELKENCREAFLQEFHQLIPKVRAESGCIEYQSALDLPSGIAAQSPIRPNSVMVVEKWADLPALQAHLQAPHMIDYRTRVKDWVVKVQLQILNPA